MTDENIIARAKEVFDAEIKGLGSVRDSIGSSFVEAVRTILDITSAGGIAVVTGVGKNLHVAEKTSAILASTGTRSIVLNPVQAMHGDLGMVSPKDVLIALSFSGESTEINNLIPAIRRHGLKIISLTGNSESTLAKLSDIHVAVPCGKEACPFGMAPTSSTTATMALGDAIAMVLVEARRFSIEEYAGNHPAGAIGRALLLKAADIMRIGKNLAKVGPTATVMQTVMAMTAAKGGSAIVVDGDDHLLGIFTDGDFRRVVAKSDDCDQLLSAEINGFMTRAPIFVFDDQYAAEMLKIFEHKRIDDLPVCARDGRVVGLVDIQDLPKMKVL